MIEKSLILFYVSKSDKTPIWVKTMIVGALGYFINTVDAIPDLVPLVGFADDLGILTAVIALIAKKVSPDIKKKADEKLNEWFDSGEKPAEKPGD